MNILEQPILTHSLNYVDKLIVAPYALSGQLKLEESDIRNLAEIVKEGLENTISAEKLKSNLGHYTKNWNIDWTWISHQITWDYHNIKKAQTINKLLGGNKKVYKEVGKTDSPECWNLYLTDKNNFSSEPRLFTLSELIANGSNIGREKKDWRPVIGVTDFGFRKYHPYDNPEWEEIERYYDKTSICQKNDSDIWDSNERKFASNPNQPPPTELQKALRRLIKITVTDGNGNIISRNSKNTDEN